jgi:HD-GYP domain-containing protein (c-di-GMP phosphodiesterase class II)
VAAWAGERREVVEAIRSHHERLDGHGYPDGRRGAAVSLVSQIVAAADVLQALASARSYKPAWQAESIRGYFDANRRGWVAQPVWEAAIATIEDVARSTSATRGLPSAFDAEAGLVE